MLVCFIMKWCHEYLNTSEIWLFCVTQQKVKKLFPIGWHQCDVEIKLLSRHPANGYLNNRCTDMVWSLCRGHIIEKMQAPVPFTNFRLLFQDERHQQLTAKIWMRLVSTILFFSFLIAVFQGESDLTYMIDILHRSVIVFYGTYNCWVLALTGKWLSIIFGHSWWHLFCQWFITLPLQLTQSVASQLFCRGGTIVT